jgi:hypothetical protein
VGKKCLNIDILGNIYKLLFGKERSFGQYFVGANNSEKNKILDYAVYFIAIIIVLNFISLLFNYYLWKKDKYVENNNFYLHSRRIFIINSLIHIACAFLLTFSFASAFTVVLTSLFISFNTWNYLPKKKPKSPQTEEFLSWKNEYIRRIFFYSVLVIFIIPLIFGRFKNFYDKAMTESPEGLAKTFKELIASNDTVKSVVELIIGANFNFFHWFILIWFIKNIISERSKKNKEFWTRVNSISKRVFNYLHYYYYQESWALANKTLINLGDYSYLENGPNFLRKGYLENDLDIDNFARQNQKIVKYIEFCEDKIKEPAKKNFLHYCLFNEFNSWEDCARAQKLIAERTEK